MTETYSENQVELREYLSTGFSPETMPPIVQDTLIASAEFVSLPPNSTLLRQGTRAEKIYIVMSGHFKVYSQTREGREQLVGEITTRTWLGEMQVLLDSQATATVRTSASSLLACWSQTLLLELMEKEPALLKFFTSLVSQRQYSNLLKLTLSRYFPMFEDELLEEMKKAGEWQYLQYGEALCRQGEPGDSLFLVLQGRLSVVLEEQGKEPRKIGEFGQGGLVGEFALFGDGVRSASLYAITETSVVAYSRATFERLLQHHPELLFTICQRLVQRIQSKDSHRSSEKRPPKTVAVLPLSSSVPTDAFVQKLQSALGFLGDIGHVSASLCEEELGLTKLGHNASQQTENALQQLHVQHWLEKKENQYSMVLYEADPTSSWWTHHCFKQAETVILLASSGDSPALTEVEQSLTQMECPWVSKPKELVLLHPEDCVQPSGTLAWLEERELERHHHVRWSIDTDLSRIARFLTHRAIGVVLGGGGAKGISHVGALLAFEDAGIPIDFLGGASMGGGVALQYAIGTGFDESIEKLRRFGHKKKPFGARTLPLYSLYDGVLLDVSLQDNFGTVHIEDMWLNGFCVSCDLTDSRALVHRQGRAWRAVRASMSAPGLLRPMVDNQHLLVDGGVLDNLPGELMKSLNPGPLFVFDVGGLSAPPVEMTYEGWPSPWKTLLSWLNPFAKRKKAPSMVEVMVQSMLTHSVSRRQRDLEIADQAFRPPVEDFSIFDFHRFDEIMQCGYDYTRKELESWEFDPERQELSRKMEPRQN